MSPEELQHRSCQEYACGPAAPLFPSLGLVSSSQQAPVSLLPSRALLLLFNNQMLPKDMESVGTRGPGQSTYRSLFFRVLTSRLRPSLASVASSSSR